MRIQKVIRASLVAGVLFLSVSGVASAAGCDDKKQRGCEVPEVPYTAILPATAMAGIAGFYFLQHRRTAEARTRD